MRSAEEIEPSLASIPLPVFIKTVQDDLPHKSEAGGVAGPIATLPDAVTATEAMLHRFDAPVLIETQHLGLLECLVGLTLDGPYGAVITCGLGGIWVETLKDVQHRRAPIDPAEVREMLTALTAAPILLGSRGRPAIDLDATCDVIATISQLANIPGLSDLVSALEINPLLVSPTHQPVALDCVLSLTPEQEN